VVSFFIYLRGKLGNIKLWTHYIYRTTHNLMQIVAK